MPTRPNQHNLKFHKMERMRSKVKIEKAVNNWKRLQEERQRETQKEVAPILEKIVVRKKETQDSLLKDIA